MSEDIEIILKFIIKKSSEIIIMCQAVTLWSTLVDNNNNNFNNVEAKHESLRKLIGLIKFTTFNEHAHIGKQHNIFFNHGEINQMLSLYIVFYVPVTHHD